MIQVSSWSPTSKPLHWESSLQSMSLWETFQIQILKSRVEILTALQWEETRGIQTLVGVTIKIISVVYHSFHWGLSWNDNSSQSMCYREVVVHLSLNKAERLKLWASIELHRPDATVHIPYSHDWSTTQEVWYVATDMVFELQCL